MNNGGNEVKFFKSILIEPIILGFLVLYVSTNYNLIKEHVNYLNQNHPLWIWIFLISSVIYFVSIFSFDYLFYKISRNIGANNIIRYQSTSILGTTIEGRPVFFFIIFFLSLIYFLGGLYILLRIVHATLIFNSWNLVGIVIFVLLSLLGLCILNKYVGATHKKRVLIIVLEILLLLFFGVVYGLGSMRYKFKGEKKGVRIGLLHCGKKEPGFPYTKEQLTYCKIYGNSIKEDIIQKYNIKEIEIQLILISKEFGKEDDNILFEKYKCDMLIGTDKQKYLTFCLNVHDLLRTLRNETYNKVYSYFYDATVQANLRKDYFLPFLQHANPHFWMLTLGSEPPVNFDTDLLLATVEWICGLYFGITREDFNMANKLIQDSVNKINDLIGTIEGDPNYRESAQNLLKLRSLIFSTYCDLNIRQIMQKGYIEEDFDDFEKEIKEMIVKRDVQSYINAMKYYHIREFPKKETRFISDLYRDFHGAMVDTIRNHPFRKSEIEDEKKNIRIMENELILLETHILFDIMRHDRVDIEILQNVKTDLLKLNDESFDNIITLNTNIADLRIVNTNDTSVCVAFKDTLINSLNKSPNVTDPIRARSLFICGKALLKAGTINYQMSNRINTVYQSTKYIEASKYFKEASDILTSSKLPDIALVDAILSKYESFPTLSLIENSTFETEKFFCELLKKHHNNFRNDPQRRDRHDEYFRRIGVRCDIFREIGEDTNIGLN